jgi:hypothetical protein
VVISDGYMPLHYQWQQNGTNIVNSTNATLVIPHLSTDNAGDYQVTVSNSGGLVTSKIASLTVRIPPLILEQPQSQTVNLGANIYYLVNASGELPLYYQWKLNNVNLPGATNSLLLLSNVSKTNAGNYSVVVSNSGGATPSLSATLTVRRTPIILIQPSAQTGYWGNPVSLSVSADGTEPLNYQWYKNGQILEGATNAVIEFIDLNFDAEGSYTVSVNNSVGNIISEKAVLTVYPADISIGLFPGVLIRGVVGRTYGVEFTVDPTAATSWQQLTNFTLIDPQQLWIDTTANTTTTNWSKRFYKVIAIP